MARLKTIETVVWHSLHTYAADPTYTLVIIRQKAEGRRLRGRRQEAPRQEAPRQG
ncbi:MAG: hypothetical protein F6J96_18085 [Symploca sp. SIO1C2]|nr:hypothetical protein [Symploca sp. SIO1C2]